MSIEALKNQNRDLIKKDLNDLRNEIDKGQKKTEEKEVLDSITVSIVYEKFLENIAEIKNSNNPEERQEKIKSIKDTFSED
jgi:pyruvate/oxaloacetate carboxyltransferase